jgi:hypothetical protein
VDDTLTITFVLATGQTALGADRALILPAALLWTEAHKIRFDPTLEDMGVGFMLDDPNIVAVDIAWVDDYEDTSDPVLTATSLYFVDNTERPSSDARDFSDLRLHAVDVPYYASGVQVIEWIVNYMQNDVYHQDRNQESN